MDFKAKGESGDGPEAAGPEEGLSDLLHADRAKETRGEAADADQGADQGGGEQEPAPVGPADDEEEGPGRPGLAAAIPGPDEDVSNGEDEAAEDQGGRRVRPTLGVRHQRGGFKGPQEQDKHGRRQDPGDQHPWAHRPVGAQQNHGKGDGGCAQGPAKELQAILRRRPERQRPDCETSGDTNGGSHPEIAEGDWGR